MNSDTAEELVYQWVRANGKIIDPFLWQSYRMKRIGMELYDLRHQICAIRKQASSTRDDHVTLFHPYYSVIMNPTTE